MKYVWLLCATLLFIQCKNNSSETDKLTIREQFLDSLVNEMTLEEKIGQTNLRGTSSREKGNLSEALISNVQNGNVGAFLNITNAENIQKLQKIAREESRLGIPLLFGRDVIHGYKTIFPIPIGLAASFQPNIVEQSARVSAIEATSNGNSWTFSPMLDIARDSRWGRVAESPGEDPYLASKLAEAYIKGYHGDSLNSPSSLVACPKHFLAYGAAIGGRDYNTVNISEALLRNVYTPPFEAAFNAGGQTTMSAFNEVNGEPASGSKHLLTTILREELGFDGFVVSDWNSVTEMIAHGFAKDEKHAAQLGMNSGLDMEMTTTTYEDYAKELILEGKLHESQLDFLVKNILRVKYNAGLFHGKQNRNTQEFYLPESLKSAKSAAIQSAVLLKNNNVLPLNKNTKIAVIGPLAHQKREQLGTWSFDAETNKTITPIDAFKKDNIDFTFVETLSFSRDKNTTNFDDAINAAKASDVIIFIGGEEAILSGEAHSRANIDLPGAQEALIGELSKTGKPLVLVLLSGRPNSISKIIDKVDAILMAWHPGTMGGPAISDILFGIAEPGGRLPISWPKTAGQLPYFYNHKNTGRPANKEDFVQMDSIPIEAWQSSLGNDSHYLDIGYTPQFPFGYGLGYSKFSYSDIQVSKDTISFSENLKITATISNIGAKKSTEVAQLYVQDVIGSITRPIRELKGFQHITLEAGTSTVVHFTISSKDLEFTNNQLIKSAESGDFNVWIGPNAAEGLASKFYLN